MSDGMGTLGGGAYLTSIAIEQFELHGVYRLGELERRRPDLLHVAGLDIEANRHDVMMRGFDPAFACEIFLHPRANVQGLVEVPFKEESLNTPAQLAETVGKLDSMWTALKQRHDRGIIGHILNCRNRC